MNEYTRNGKEYCGDSTVDEQENDAFSTLVGTEVAEMDFWDSVGRGEKAGFMGMGDELWYTDPTTLTDAIDADGDTFVNISNRNVGDRVCVLSVDVSDEDWDLPSVIGTEDTFWVETEKDGDTYRNYVFAAQMPYGSESVVVTDDAGDDLTIDVRNWLSTQPGDDVEILSVSDVTTIASDESVAHELVDPPESGTQWGDVRRKFGDDDIPVTAARYAAVQLLDEQYDMFEWSDNMYVYDDETGVYRGWGDKDGSDGLITAAIEAGMKDRWSTTHKKEIVERLKDRNQEPRINEKRNAGEEDRRLVCVKNGVLDIDSRELLDHSPDYYFTTRLPVEYDPDAEAPLFNDFLDSVFGRKEAAMSMLELVGNGLRPGYETQKFGIMVGPSNSGKSTFFRIIKQVFGTDNTSGTPLHKIATNDEAAAHLDDSMLNVDPDMSGTKLKDTSMLLKLTGDDDVYVRRLYEQGFEMQNEAQIFGVTNDPFVIPDKDGEVHSRIVPIYTPNQFTSDPDDGNPDKDPELEESIKSSDEELSGILNLILDGIDRLEENNDVSLPESEDERYEMYRSLSDPMYMFAKDCLTNDPGATLKQNTVHQVYNRFATEMGSKTSSKTALLEQLRQSDEIVFETARPSRPDGSRPRVVEGIALTDDGMEYVDEALVSSDPWLDRSQSDGAEVVALTDMPDNMVSDSQCIEVRVVENVETSEAGPAAKHKVECVVSGQRAQLVSWSPQEADEYDVEAGETYQIKKVGRDERGSIVTRPTLTEVDRVDSGVETVTTDGDTSVDSFDSSEVSQEERVELVIDAVESRQDEFDDGVPVNVIAEEVEAVDADMVEDTVESLCAKGEIYSPLDDGRVLSL